MLHFIVANLSADLFVAVIACCANTVCFKLLNNGFNRIGGNAGTETLVFGKIAGKIAGEEAVKGEKQ